MYQGYPLKLLETKISQNRLDTLKLTSIYTATNQSIKNLKYPFQEKTSNNTQTKFHSTGTIQKGIETI